MENSSPLTGNDYYQSETAPLQLPSDSSIFPSVAAESKHWQAKATEYARLVREKDAEIVEEQWKTARIRNDYNVKVKEVAKLTEEKTVNQEVVEKQKEKIQALTLLHADQHASLWQESYIKKSEDWDRAMAELKAIRYVLDLEDDDNIISEIHRRLSKVGTPGTIEVRDDKGPKGELYPTAVLHLEMAMSKEEFPILLPWVQAWLDDASKQLYAAVKEVKPVLLMHNAAGLRMKLEPAGVGPQDSLAQSMQGPKPFRPVFTLASSPAFSTVSTPDATPARVVSPLSAEDLRWAPPKVWFTATSGEVEKETDTVTEWSAEGYAARSDYNLDSSAHKVGLVTPPGDNHDLFYGIRMTPLSKSWADFGTLGSSALPQEEKLSIIEKLNQ